MKNYVIYRGAAFTVEWYYNAHGKSQALGFFNDLDDDSQDSLINIFSLMAEMGEIKNKTKFRNEGDGIFAFKSRENRF